MKFISRQIPIYQECRSIKLVESNMFKMAILFDFSVYRFYYRR